MQTRSIGVYIKQRRRSLGLTQEKLCSGICDSTTLSRIENGRHTPGKTIINALLQRLGLPEDRYYAIVTDNEIAVETLKKEIMGYNATKAFDKCAEAIERLKALTMPDDVLTRQFILRSEAFHGENVQQLDMLLEAIHLTIPQFDLNAINEFVYTFDEIKLINQIGIAYSNLGQSVTCIHIYEQLVAYMDTHCGEILSGSGLLPMVLHNYARELDIDGQYEACINVCERGRLHCIQYANYQFFPGFFSLMAEAQHYCGNDEKSREFYYQAYYMFRALDNKPSLAVVREEAKKYLNLKFEY